MKPTCSPSSELLSSIQPDDDPGAGTGAARPGRVRDDRHVLGAAINLGSCPRLVEALKRQDHRQQRDQRE